MFKVHQTTAETITPSTEICYNRFTTETLGTRKDSIVSKANDNMDFKIFSNGSGQDGHIGAAAVISLLSF